MVSSRLVDPLSEVTRKKRRMLMAVSMLGVFFVKAGALPTKVTALGIQLEPSDQKVFLYLLAVGIMYLISAFVIYALSDYIVWRDEISKEELSTYEQDMLEKDHYPEDRHAQELQAVYWDIYKREAIWKKLTKPLSKTRAAFEFLLPLIVGLCSSYVVFQNAYTGT